MPNPTPDPDADRLLDRYRDAIIDMSGRSEPRWIPLKGGTLTVGGDPDAVSGIVAEAKRGPQASPNTERHPPEGLRPGGHWACERPNPDKITSDTAFDFTCPDCRRVAEAVKRVLGADAGFVTRTRSGVEIPTQLGVHDLLDSTRRHNPEGKDHRR